MRRTLIAGFGNVLRGDDGFGVEVLRRLGEPGALPPGVTLLDVGTGGIHLAQELLAQRYDRLVIVDAATRGGPPGSLYTLVVDAVRPAHEIDMHTTVPSGALELAQAFGALPAEVYLVGCEPAQVDDLTIELSPAVAAALDGAVRAVRMLIGEGREMTDDASGAPGASDAGGADDAGGSIAREDELLQLLFWFEGEGFAGSATLPGITRFTALSAPVVVRTLDRLIARGDVVRAGADGSEFRLTETGRREAGRRFAAEFAPMLSQGHGECSDPSCDCHTSEAGAAECHARTHAHGHTH